MGQFIISRSAAGDRFSLRSDSGRILAVSRNDATLDACKKGIASLIVNAPVIPVLDATVGEYGRNPKFEIVAAGTGFTFLMKSANGKSVLTSPAYATKKACLRAISMLRRGVADYEILFYTKEGLTPLTMKPPRGAAAKPALPKPLLPPEADKPPFAPEPIEAESFPDEAEQPQDACDEVSPATQEQQIPTPSKAELLKETPSPLVAAQTPKEVPVTPRLIRLEKSPKAAPARARTRVPQKPSVARELLSKLFKKYK